VQNPHIGSSLESFLEEDGTRDEILDLAQKRVLAWQIAEAMKESGIRKIEMAERMHMSHTQVERLLDPASNKVQLDTLQRAARAVGRTLKMELA